MQRLVVPHRASICCHLVPLHTRCRLSFEVWAMLGGHSNLASVSIRSTYHFDGSPYLNGSPIGLYRPLHVTNTRCTFKLGVARVLISSPITTHTRIGARPGHVWNSFTAEHGPFEGLVLQSYQGPGFNLAADRVVLPEVSHAHNMHTPRVAHTDMHSRSHRPPDLSLTFIHHHPTLRPCFEVRSDRILPISGIHHPSMRPYSRYVSMTTA